MALVTVTQLVAVKLVFSCKTYAPAGAVKVTTMSWEMESEGGGGAAVATVILNYKEGDSRIQVLLPNVSRNASDPSDQRDPASTLVLVV